MPYKDPEKARVAKAESYRRNKKRYDQEQRDRRNVYRKYIQEYKTGKPCTDCQIVYPFYVLDFDHLPQYEKKFNIGTTSNVTSMEALIDEVNKCELVCSNCHRVRTYERFGR